MPIISSTHIVGHAQKDNRRYVIETHTDNLNNTYIVEYLASPTTNYTIVRDARALQINEYLADTEAQAVIDNGT